MSTDLAVFHWGGGQFVLEAVAPGFTTDDIRFFTEMEFCVAPALATMETA